MKKINYVLVILVLFLFPIFVDAATVSVKSSVTTIVKGGKATITATISDSKAIFFTEGKLSCTGAGVNKSVSMSWDNTDNSKKSKSFSLSVTASQSGTITCKTSNVKFTGGSSGSWTNIANKSLTIKVREKSTNNDLKSLSVDGYSISPKFNKDTLEYTVNLESNVEKIKINASKSDSYSSVTGTGEKEVLEGANKFEIVVTSETGKSKTYILNAIVKDSNPIIRKVDGKEYSVVKRESALTIPDGFTKTTITIDEVEVPAFYNETTTTTLIGLKDDAGVIYLFKYDNNNLTKYQTLMSTSMTIVFENTDEEISNFTKTVITIDDKEYSAYKHNDNSNYVLIYGTELSTNNKGWYLYNVKEKSIQTYTKDLFDNIENEFDNTLNEYKIVILSLAGLSLLLLVIIIVQISSKNKLKKKFKNKIQMMKEKEVVEKEKTEKVIDPVKKESKKTKEKSNKKTS